MLIDVKVPPLPESVADATLINWHKQAGDTVTEGESLVDLETDKVTLDVPAPEAGVLTEIRRDDNETVKSEDVIAVIDTEASDARQEASVPEDAPRGGDFRPTEEEQPPKLSPSVRKLLIEHGLNAEDVAASSGERITREDIERLVESRKTGQADRSRPVHPTSETARDERRGERREPMSRLRRRIAERLVAVQQESAILTTFNEINMQRVMEARKRYGEPFERAHGVKLGFMSFFVAAVVEALRRFPVVNASIEGDQVVYHDYQDIGIAVSSPRGLVVPVLRGAGHMSMAQIEEAIADFGRRARDNMLDIDDLSGGTFTITNGGIFGSLLSTPILNPPQSGILGMHKIQERPVAEGGQVVVRPIMYVALSYDHRLIDGRDAVQFLVAVKDLVGDPERIILQV